MEIMLEKCLRELLSKRKKTQSELAEHLSISTQAVSKWCRGENMPYIALLPKIASFLDVSVDELLGVGEIRRQEKIREYQVKSFESARDGHSDKCVELWREAYAEFPNDMEVNKELMCALYFAKDGKYHDEALALGERILRESTDEEKRSCAINILCLIHSIRGSTDKAKEYANMATAMYASRDVMLAEITKGDECVHQNLELMLECLSIITNAESKLCPDDDDERRLQLHEFSLKLLELFFDDGFYGVYALVAADRHKRLAKIYLSHGKDEQKTSLHLKNAAKFAKQYDALPRQPESFVYTSTLMNGHKNTRAVLLPYTETESEQLLTFINDPDFDSVRERDWFRSVAEELKG